MARCSFCFKSMGFREDKLTFDNPKGLEFCLDCMTCSVCGAEGQQQKGGLLGMTPLCPIHYDKYNRVLPLVPVTKWPEETLDGRLKYLYRVKDRDTRLLTQFECERPKKIDDIVGETISGSLGFITETQLDIKVLDDPTTVADIEKKVLDFLKLPDNEQNRDAIAILDVEYAIICAR